MTSKFEESGKLNPPMRVELSYVGTHGSGHNIVLTELPALVGREDADASIDDSWISHFHCMISESDGVLEVRDLGSRTGTFVNGRRIEKVRLMPGDKLTVGRSDYLVRYEPQFRGYPPVVPSTAAAQAALRKT